MASAAQVCDLLGPPERNDALAAVARTIALIRRRHALTVRDIAKKLKNDRGEQIHFSTIQRAENRATLLEFDTIIQLAYLFGDCGDPIRQLLESAPTGEPVTLEERLERAEREILAVRRELVGREGCER